MPESSVSVTAYGAGTRQYEGFPNALRMIIGDSAEIERDAPSSGDRLIVMETNIDDVSPQVMGFVMERAFDLGALDCWFTPIQMKKNRPAVMVSILCEPERRNALTELLYRETTTIGIRIRETERESLERETVSAATPFGNIDVKVARLNGRVVNAMPEYDQIKAAALSSGAAFKSVHDAVMSNFGEKAAAGKAAA